VSELRGLTLRSREGIMTRIKVRSPLDCFGIEDGVALCTSLTSSE